MPSIRKCDGQWQVLAAARAVLAISILAVAFAGCTKQPWSSDIDGNAVACRSTYDFEPGTPEFEQCMQKFREIDARKNGGRAF